LPSSSGDRLCPICDSPLQPGSRKCGFCGTDLSIFDIETEPVKKVPEQAAPPKPSVESRVDEILSSPRQSDTLPPKRTPEAAQKPIPQPPEQISSPAPRAEIRAVPEPKPTPAPEPIKEVEPEPVIQAESVGVEVETFECPQCGTPIDATATKCPQCGVMFADEDTDMFQCPACNTLVSVDAESCPGCGAVFVEPEPPAVTPKKDIEPPIAEIKAPSKKPAKPVELEKKEEKVEERKGLKALFKWGRKAAEPSRKPEPSPEITIQKETPAPAPSPAIHPAKSSEVHVREIKHEEVTPVRAPVSPASKDKGRDLARMVAEMKPLLALAREKEVDIGESKQLIDNAAAAGRERQIERAIELVQKSKEVLMGRIDSNLADVIAKLNEEIKVARDFGGDVSRPSTYIQEVARARAAGDVEAAYVYAEKAAKELLPITGRYNESKKKVEQLKNFIADCDVFIIDTRDARRLMMDSSKALEAKDFDKMDLSIKMANESLSKSIPDRMNEELRKARDELIDAKVRNVNITPMLTILKSATSLMKSGEYQQAIKEMREFKEMMKSPA
jgi:cellobiose-specific phosphotransferase system component IIA